LSPPTGTRPAGPSASSSTRPDMRASDPMRSACLGGSIRRSTGRSVPASRSEAGTALLDLAHAQSDATDLEATAMRRALNEHHACAPEGAVYVRRARSSAADRENVADFRTVPRSPPG
jgi:hypothetical protein